MYICLKYYTGGNNDIGKSAEKIHNVRLHNYQNKAHIAALFVLPGLLLSALLVSVNMNK